MMKAAARAAAMGGSKGRAAKAAARVAQVAAAKARIAAAAALAQFCGNSENANDPQCLVLDALKKSEAERQQKLLEYNTFCDANYWSFSCSAIWGWLAFIVIIVLICCCCYADYEEDERRRRRY